MPTPEEKEQSFTFDSLGIRPFRGKERWRRSLYPRREHGRRDRRTRFFSLDREVYREW